MYKLLLALGIVLLLTVAVWYFFFRGYTIKNYPPKNDTIVAFGDSLVEGVGSDSGGFVSLLSKMLGKPVVNMGVSGNTTDDGYQRLEVVLKTNPGIVLVLLGGNDAIRKMPIDGTFSNLEKIITELQRDGILVVLLGVRGNLLSDTYEKKYKELAERTGSAYVPNVLKGVFARPDLMHDAIHPNDKGYAIIADRVYEVLEPLVFKK